MVRLHVTRICRCSCRTSSGKHVELRIRYVSLHRPKSFDSIEQGLMKNWVYSTYILTFPIEIRDKIRHMVQDVCVLLYISVYATLVITPFCYAFQVGRTIVRHARPVYFLN